MYRRSGPIDYVVVTSQWGSYFIIDGAANGVTKDVMTSPFFCCCTAEYIVYIFIQDKTLSIPAILLIFHAKNR
jgi:hypothetical protein